MLTVHHLGISQSERIVWLCEELGVPYDLAHYDRDPVTRFAPETYRALHPFGTAPVITDGNVTLGETGAIMDYIIAKHGGGRLAVGSDDPAFADYLYWYHFANASLMPAKMVDVIVAMMGEAAESGVADALRVRGTRALAMMEQRLGEAPYFGGDFTAADIMMVFPLTTMRLFAPMDLSASPNIRAYLRRIGERRAYRRAMEKADPGLERPLD